MRKGLLTPNDVIRYTPVKLNFNPCSFRELYAIEYTEAVRCLGVEFWKDMVAALADYSKARAYDPSNTYAVDEVVVWSGGYRIALNETSQNPNYAVDWTDAPRFTGEAADSYDDLFCTFLAPYLSYAVLSERLPYILTQISDGGMTYSGRKYNAQDKERIESLERAIFRDREKAYQVLENFMQDENTKAVTYYAKYKPYLNETTDACTCQLSTCDECRNRRPRHVGRYRFGDVS